jgi:DNA-binding MarR family transcriptional regulator
MLEEVARLRQGYGGRDGGHAALIFSAVSTSTGLQLNARKKGQKRLNWAHLEALTMTEQVVVPTEQAAATDAGQVAEPRRRMTQRGKTLRAFRAYLDLLDTAEHMRAELRGQLASFDLTIRGFRLLETLYRDGPTFMTVAAKKLNCKRQNVDVILARLMERGWVVRELWERPPVEIDEARVAKAKRSQERRGRTISLLRLTPEGEKFIGTVFPKHGKVVKSLMRALDGREQETLSKLLQKLKEGDAVKYAREMWKMDEDEEWESEE